jgi:hypothetical protein
MAATMGIAQLILKYFRWFPWVYPTLLNPVSISKYYTSDTLSVQFMLCVSLGLKSLLWHIFDTSNFSQNCVHFVRTI